ncbi:unnamed protein product [Lepidochelys kempii]
MASAADPRTAPDNWSWALPRSSGPGAAAVPQATPTRGSSGSPPGAAAEAGPLATPHLQEQQQHLREHRPTTISR